MQAQASPRADLRPIAFRIILDTVSQCSGLGLIHSLEADDLKFRTASAVPANMYQSLHTTVIRPVEANQFRSDLEMDRGEVESPRLELRKGIASMKTS
jgi:(p)ppGpp synthase/HD superfamily hydrolase